MQQKSKRLIYSQRQICYIHWSLQWKGSSWQKLAAEPIQLQFIIRFSQRNILSDLSPASANPRWIFLISHDFKGMRKNISLIYCWSKLDSATAMSYERHLEVNFRKLSGAVVLITKFPSALQNCGSRDSHRMNVATFELRFSSKKWIRCKMKSSIHYISITILFQKVN